MIDFYTASGSPFGWRVGLSLEHKQLPHAQKLLSFSAGDLRTDSFAAINPRKQVPAIVDDGFALYESAAIVEYLEDRYPERPLFPKGVREKASVRRMILEADHHLGASMERLVGQLLQRKEPERDATTIASARQGVLDELARFEHSLVHPFLGGEAVTAIDFTVYPMIALVLRMQDRFDPKLGVREAIAPKVSSWMKRIESLPYFDKTYPPHWRG